MTITKTQNGDTVILHVDGRIDTNTSPQLQKEVLNALQTAKVLQLDLEKVLYLSSAGLRVLLVGQKTAASKKGTMELLHVTPTVKAILDSVGFSAILTLK